MDEKLKCSLCENDYMVESVVFRKGSKTAFKKHFCKACRRELNGEFTEANLNLIPEGTINFNRVYGHQDLFQSEIQTGSYIKMEIHTANKERDFNQDRIYNDDLVAIINMSANQFAEAITNMNMGSGVPCTISHVKGHKINRFTRDSVPEIEKVRKEIGQTIKDSLENVFGIIKEMNVEKGLSKKETKDLQFKLSNALSHVSSNPAFSIERFQETMQKIETKSKIEIASYLEHKLIEIGVDSLRVKLDENRLVPLGLEYEEENI